MKQLLKYSFVGSKERVKKQLWDFLGETRVNELIVASFTYARKDRLKSTKLFEKIMMVINN
ncbi:MAG: hypothetical protein WD431_12820 [Cyclobacteriaceae bacterium]